MVRSLVILALAMCLFPAPCRSQWLIGGKAVSTATNNQSFPAITDDGSGGVVIVWEDTRSGTPDIYAQRLDAFGQTLWTANGVAMCTAAFNQQRPTIVADGTGGFIVAWGDDRAAANNFDVYAQRLNASGVVQWAANGVALCTAANNQQYPSVISDGAGGAIVAWPDERTAISTYHVYAQRVNNSGTPLWTANGAAIYTASSTGGSYAMARDGAGGAIFAYPISIGDIYAQRISAAGAPQWAVNGAAVCTAANVQGMPSIVSDDANGAIVAWQDFRNGADNNLFAQRINGSGVAQWAANGVALCSAANTQANTTMVTDGSSGAIVAWEDLRSGTRNDIYAQKVSSAGVVQWTANGVALCAAIREQQQIKLVSDNAGGALAAWADFRNAINWPFPETGDCFVQHVSATGALWATDGLTVIPSATPGDAIAPQIATNGSGGAFVAFADTRNGSNIDMYLQRFENRYGYWGRPDARITSVNDVAGDQGGHVMSVWAGSDRDIFPQQEISHYTLWRELSASALQSPSADAFIDPSAVGADFSEKAYRRVATASGATTWEFIATVPIRYASSYAFNTATLADSTASDDANATYQVLAHTTNAFVYYESNLFAGNSVDNLSPPAPLSLTAQRAGPNVNLKWNRVHVADLKNYSVYRKTSSGVTPVPANFLASATDTVLVDNNAGALYYIVTANDVHDNQSAASNEVSISAATAVDGTPAISSLSVSQWPNPFAGSTRFQVGIPRASNVRLEIFDVGGRRVHTVVVDGARAGWYEIPFSGRDRRGMLLASGVYFCRVSAAGATVTKKMVIAR
jgi:hypothetical protein